MSTTDAEKIELSETALWDVVVIGGGMGGGILTSVLAAQGWRVLVLERGRPRVALPKVKLAEKIKRVLFATDEEKIRSARGRWPYRLSIKRGRRFFDFYPPMGSGAGGSSAIYGAALERFQPEDFTGCAVEAGVRPLLPTSWPIDYPAFEPYYAQAEALLGVCGTRDPLHGYDNAVLRPPPKLSERDAALYQSFQDLGLSPYRLHVGIEYRPGCTECVGAVCPRECKSEGYSRGLKPALQSGRVTMLLDCHVQRLDTEDGAVSTVHADVAGRKRQFRGRIVVLSAGALNSPVVLLNSRTAEFPNGIGNQNDLVGRGLMFHISDFFALWSDKTLDPIGPKKTLSSRAFYSHDRQKLGGFQSVGIAISVGQIAGFLDDWIRRNIALRLHATAILTRAIASLVVHYFKDASLFATIMEDFPYRDNRIVADPARPSGFYIDYEKAPELRRRIATMRRLVKTALKPLRPHLLSADDNLNFGHPSGTCRFGTDPAVSVLDPDTKVWGTKNLYVVDASFFPSCGGANPSLTIAANALRVGEIIGSRLR
jgi:choline dehydrogenase-like flavoprotein